MATQDILHPADSATRFAMADSVAGLIQAVRRVAPGGAGAKDAVAALCDTERDLRQNNRHFACLKAAWHALNASEDIALRAPEVVHHLQQVGSLFGVS